MISHIVGGAIILALASIIFGATVRMQGWFDALVCWLASAGFVALFVLGLYLLVVQ